MVLPHRPSHAHHPRWPRLNFIYFRRNIHSLFMDRFSKGGAAIPAWFDITEVPITAKSTRDEKGVLKAVQVVHAMIDKEIADGVSPGNIFICGFSQGGALTTASIMLYPKTLGGGVVFSGSVPLGSSIEKQIPLEARKTPILWLHGMADDIVLFEAGQAGCHFLEQLGMSCEFKAYPGLGHVIVDEELEYFQSWIRNHLKKSA
ncbi:probable carboxylesterase Os04g0669500 isoform X2 [Ananas comosus]|uniref:Probable carboxylesterase Os04g0669500 isoform X2 n=1 Tax=Ananas comosus TaxID=4615 RepID=A0A6P5EK34_ANACO|nr:probable carboxylesterase Os04g0669500 isoform X2 [Ananas comosus]